MLHELGTVPDNYRPQPCNVSEQSWLCQAAEPRQSTLGCSLGAKSSRCTSSINSTMQEPVRCASFHKMIVEKEAILHWVWLDVDRPYDLVYINDVIVGHFWAPMRALVVAHLRCCIVRLPVRLLRLPAASYHRTKATGTSRPDRFAL